MSANMDEIKERIVNRHIAKILTRLGVSIAPVQQSEIKRQMWFLADDIVAALTENQEISDESGNKCVQG